MRSPTVTADQVQIVITAVYDCTDIRIDACTMSSYIVEALSAQATLVPRPVVPMPPEEERLHTMMNLPPDNPIRIRIRTVYGGGYGP